MTQDHYSIKDFSKEEFYKIFLNENTVEENVKINTRIQYLASYLSIIQCKKIIIENDYTDKDYLLDYQDFYVRCFKNYSKICKRAHFFSVNFSNEDIERILNAKEDKDLIEKLQENYLGFTVIKPLPEKVVGKTCIKNFEDSDKRAFLATRDDYKVHLFGIEFKVKSLAFQEQDTIMGACATISLWCAFHKTSQLFGHGVYSPGEITRSATKHYLSGTREIPSEGLTIDQILDGIRQTGLTYEVTKIEKDENNKDMKDKEILLGTIYAYLKMEIPVILGIVRPDGRRHAVTITGYRLERINEGIKGKTNLIASSINRLYAHDDNIGPFSRVYITEKEYPQYIINMKQLKSPSESKDYPIEAYDFSEKLINFRPGLKLEFVYPPEDTKKEVTPYIMVIPLYHKIRINFKNICSEINKINGIFKYAFEDPVINWDIFLSTSNSLKSDLLKDSKINKKIRKEILTRSMPKYIWRCKAFSNNNEMMEIIADSTDINANNSLLDIIGSDISKKELKLQFEEVLSNPIRKNGLIGIAGQRFMVLFEKYIEE